MPRRPRKTRTKSMRMNLREAQAVVSVVTGNRMADPGRYSHLELAGSTFCDRYVPMSRIGQKRTPVPESTNLAERALAPQTPVVLRTDERGRTTNPPAIALRLADNTEQVSNDHLLPSWHGLAQQTARYANPRSACHLANGGLIDLAHLPSPHVRLLRSPGPLRAGPGGPRVRRGIALA
jgi:hypothetical protein